MPRSRPTATRASRAASPSARPRGELGVELAGEGGRRRVEHRVLVRDHRGEARGHEGGGDAAVPVHAAAAPGLARVQEDEAQAAPAHAAAAAPRRRAAAAGPRSSSRRSEPSRSASSNSPWPTKCSTSTPPGGEPSLQAARRRPRQDLDLGAARLHQAGEGLRRSAVSVAASSGAAPRGRDDDDEDAQPAPRRRAGASAGTAVKALRTKFTEEVARNSRREGSKASSQGLSATQSSIEVKTTSRGRPFCERARGVVEAPHVAGEQGLEEVAAEVAQLLPDGSSRAAGAALEHGERALVGADDPLPARAGLPAAPREGREDARAAERGEDLRGVGAAAARGSPRRASTKSSRTSPGASPPRGHARRRAQRGRAGRTAGGARARPGSRRSRRPPRGRSTTGLRRASGAPRRSGGRPARSGRRGRGPPPRGRGPRRFQAACAASTSADAECHFASTAARPPIVLLASASRSRAASSSAVWGGAARAARERAPRAAPRRATTSFSALRRLASGSRSVPSSARGEGLDEPVAHAGEALVERRHLVVGEAARLPPGRLRRLEARRRGRRAARRASPSAGSERLELRADPLARLLRGLPRVLVAVLVAVEEVVAGGAEPLPHRLGPALLDRPDRAPLGLQPLELGGGRLPVGGLPEGLGLLAEGLLLREVVAPTRGCAGRGAPASG